MASIWKNKIISSFNIYGYSLKSEALRYVLSVLENCDNCERNDVLEKVLDFVQTQSLTSSLLEKATLEQAIQLVRNVEVDDDSSLKVIDAFSLPSFYYHNDTKKFILKNTFSQRVASLHGGADSKSGILLERYKMIYQRTIRHRLFAPPAIATTENTSNQNYSLKTVEYLLGASTKQTNLIVLGMLTQLKEGQFFLEDPTGAVKLNLKKASYKDGLFVENCIVLAEGFYDEDTFYITAIGFPPPEPASVTLAHFPSFDLSGGTAMTSYRLSAKLKQIEEKNVDSMLIFLSDVWLDKLKILQKLQILFTGYADFPPTCFVFIGNFLSKPNAGDNSKLFRECFEKLGNLIADFPSLVNKSTFVFVPGPDDPGLPHILPRPPIPEALLSEFRKKVPNANFTSNPCRLQYCSQEIAIFREDVVSKMCRNSIYMPWQDKEKVNISNLFVKTIIANSHLLPLPSNVAPIYWEYDHAFWLYPLPDIVVCADKCDPYTIVSTGCTFFNPGSVPRTNFSFKVYLPASRQVEDSQIADDHFN